MGGINTEDLYTQEEVDAMVPAELQAKGVVKLTPEDQKAMAGMNRKERRKYLKDNKKFKKEK